MPWDLSGPIPDMVTPRGQINIFFMRIIFGHRGHCIRDRALYRMWHVGWAGRPGSRASSTITSTSHKDETPRRTAPIDPSPTNPSAYQPALLPA